MSDTAPATDTVPVVDVIHRRRFRRAAAGLVLASGLLVAGCGDDAGSDVRNITDGSDGGASTSGSASTSSDASETSDTTTAESSESSDTTAPESNDTVTDGG